MTAPYYGGKFIDQRNCIAGRSPELLRVQRWAEISEMSEVASVRGKMLGGRGVMLKLETINLGAVLHNRLTELSSVAENDMLPRSRAETARWTLVQRLCASVQVLTRFLAVSVYTIIEWKP